MTTKPRAKKFRIRRNSPLGSGRPRAAAENPGRPVEDGFDAKPFPTTTPADDKAGGGDPIEVRVDQEIAEIRKEGLTGRQLRMARRIAQKNGLAPTSDFDAVRLLRKAGIDPFKQANVLELVVADGQAHQEAEKKQEESKKARAGLPKTTPHIPESLPSTEVLDKDSAAANVLRIQLDIARRRRRKLLFTLARLVALVVLPTIVAGYYYYTIATPMYETKSEFVIQQAEAQATGLGGLFSGTGLATQQDSITVQSYLQSREAMRRLDADLGFVAHFSQDWIDPIQRLPEGASLEDAYKIYQRNVKLGYDPTEGLLKLRVVAADPDVSAAFSQALISYAEERVDSLTQRLREDQMAGARDSFREAERRVTEAQTRVLELQERLGVLDPRSEEGALMGQIVKFEMQLREKRLQLDQLLDNTRPNKARVDGVKGDIRRLEALVAELRASMTESTSGTESLARISAEVRIAEADLANRQILLQQALQQLESARIEANRQVRYLSLGVSPVPPDEPTYPRAFENTLLAFLIFGGIYLMASITVSILREQVSA